MKIFSFILIFFLSPSVIFAHQVIIGKNDWLFYTPELIEQTREVQIQKTLSLIDKLNYELKTNNVKLIVAVIPLKVKIYPEHLPNNIKLNDYLVQNYDLMLDFFNARGISAINFDRAFLTSPDRNGDDPLFFRLDSHWTPKGVMLAAETTKEYIKNDVSISQLFISIPEITYDIKFGNRKRYSQARDLVSQLPSETSNFAPDQVTQVNVIRVNVPPGGMTGKKESASIALVGSDFSRDWFGFADALRYVLQRDVVSVAVGADQGSWVGMESYLRDDAFQTAPPKVLIWEMPERDMHAPPDYKYREARYVTSNADWLKRVTELVKKAAPTRKP